MNDDVMETLKTIQWLYSNTTIDDDECALLKELAFFGDPKDIEAVISQLKDVNWLRSCDRLTADELALLKQKILGPYRERQGQGQSSSAGRQTIRLEQAPPAAGRWRHWVAPVRELAGGQPLSAAALQAALDHHGADGWELAGVLPAEDAGGPLLIFKRLVVL
ncbi:MAG TPA: hypothetical protein VGE07_11465 [Herpetosiphonaceae bacterium]